MNSLDQVREALQQFVFERDWDLAGQKFVQTLEPRAFYVYVPYRNQSQAPTFDTAVELHHIIDAVRQASDTGKEIAV